MYAVVEIKSHPGVRQKFVYHTVITVPQFEKWTLPHFVRRLEILAQHPEPFNLIVIIGAILDGEPPEPLETRTVDEAKLAQYILEQGILNKDEG